MMILGGSLKSLSIHGLDILARRRSVVIGLITAGLGVLLGCLIDSSEAGGLVISIIVTAIVLALIVNRPLNGVLVWLFFMVFIETWVKIPMGVGLPDLSFSRFTIAFLATFMLAMAAIGKFRFARIGLAEVCILAAPIGIMAAAPRSVSPSLKGVIQTAIAMHFTPLSIYFFTKNLVRNRSDLHKVFWAIAFLGFVSGAYAVYEYATGNILFVAQTSQVGMIFRGSGIRLITGIMGSTGNMGRALAAAIPVTFYLLLEREKKGIAMILLIVMLAAQFCGIYVAMSRSPWYSLLLGLLIMQFFYPKFRKLFYVIVVVAAIILWVTWDQTAESDAVGRINDENSTLEGREVRWQAGYNMWRAKPIQGWGFGRYQEESGRFRTDGESRNCSAVENDYLYILVSSGLIGFLPYLIFLLSPLINSLRLFFKVRAPDWSGFIKPETLTVYWAVILCLLITSYTAMQTQAVVKLMTFAVAGAVVGTHENLLRESRLKRSYAETRAGG